jgi:hypothetical protein
MEQIIEIEVLARQYAPQAMQALVKIATTGKSDSARVTAVTAILDRAFGGHSKHFGQEADRSRPSLFQTGLRRRTSAKRSIVRKTEKRPTDRFSPALCPRI